MRKLKIQVVYFLIVSLCSFSVISKENEQILTLVTVENLAFTPQLYQKVSLAYEEVGYVLELIEMPSKRAFIEAKNNKLIDGDLVRIEGAESIHIDYIRIPVPMYYARIKAYISEPNFTVTDWDSLSNYSLVTVRGILATNKPLEKRNLAFKAVSSPQQALNMVKRKRLNVAILVVNTIENSINIEKITHDFPYSVEIDKKAFFHFIHKRHKAIVPELTKAFEEVFSDVNSDI